MSKERKQPPDPATERDDAIERLMGDEDVPPGRQRDLDAQAMAAAEQALRQGSRAARAAIDALHDAQQPRRVLSPRGRQLLLRGALLVNLALMVFMLLLPEPPQSVSEPPAQAPAQTPQLVVPEQKHESALRDPRDLAVSVPERELYDRAVFASLEGRHEEAVALLEHYLRRHPEMPPALRATVYGQLAHYSVLLNRRDEAQRYGTMAAQLRQRTALPDELIAGARRAEAEGRGADMRRDYARLLLQQQMLRPDQRAAVAEAYLRLGDSYRIEAERNDDPAAPVQQPAPEGGK